MAVRKKWRQRLQAGWISLVLIKMNETKKHRIPPPIVELREMLCPQCSCGIDKDDPCSFCPRGRWKEFFCKKNFAPKIYPSVNGKPPSINEMVQSLAKSAVYWAGSGFRHSNEQTIRHRISICQSCEFWKAEAFNNTGRCMKCGCSTWAKIRMATESCPIGKWGPETKASV